MTAPAHQEKLTLKAAVFATTVDEHLVLLDAAAGSYLCLSAAGSVLQDDGWTLAVGDRGLAGELISAGLADPFRGPAAPRKRPPPARATALRSQYPQPRARDLCDAAIGLGDLLRHYRGRAFAEVLGQARDRPTLKTRRPAALRDVLDRFQAWIPYAPVSGKCLLRSFLLLRHLHRHGHDAMWVFGVTTWPFQAHCWLQLEDLVLDDEVDRVVAYTPIMVL